MNKTAIKNFAVWARRKLISDITYKAGMLGITEAGIAQPMAQSTKDLQFFDIGTKDYVEISGAEIQQRNALISAIRVKEKTTDYKTAFRSIVEEVAYTWFNRLIAVRFMEVNDYLPSHVRVLSSSNPNKLEPDFVTTPFETDMEFSAYEKDVVLQLKDQNKLDELFRMLFIRQCNKLSRILPELFEQISDYTELLLTISFTDKDGVIYHLTHDISEDDFNVEKEGQVEIIGWLYQYYNTEPKDEVFALLKKNVKITKERIPAATQLFTPDWIVRYMVENSLGRLWVEGHPNDDLKATWKYYLEEAEQEPEVQKQLNTIREGYAKINPEDIKLIDPCMGSGHILVYAFDLLMQIYTSYGYTQRDAAKSILKNNLYGIDIDTRAYQLAYFAVMMKARQYSRRIFDEGILPNLMAVKNSALRDGACLKRLGDLEELGRRLVTDFKDAEEYGSILQLNYSQAELDELDERLDRIDEMADYGNLVVQMESAECVNTIAPLIRQARIMSQQYDVVVTNPPYMSNSGMSEKLSEFVKTHYPDSKADLFAVFIEKCCMMLRKNGFQTMITQHTWMFLGSYEKLRGKLQSVSLDNLVHLGIKAFEEIGNDVVQTACFTIRNVDIKNRNALFVRLVDYKDYSLKEKEFFKAGNRYQQNTSSFIDIPGFTYAYWVEKSFIGNFKKGKTIEAYGEFTGSQNITGNNEKYLRCFWEIESKKIGKEYWVFYAKGGDYRKYYGNIQMVVDWRIAARKFYSSNKTSNLLNEHFWFREGITYSAVTSRGTGFRYLPVNCIFDKGGPSIALHSHLDEILSLLNSKVAETYFQVLNPSINLQVKDIKSLPIILPSDDRVSILAKKMLQIAKTDWDSYETSFGFSSHPLLNGEKVIREAFKYWSKHQEEMFIEAKEYETEINEIFAGLYGFDNLSYTFEGRDIPVRLADKDREIKSLISYAIGCMFGRYSLDRPGLVYSGEEWDDTKYVKYIPNVDAIIPICDEEYLANDVVNRFVDFIGTAFGEDTLEVNLDYIAETLGGVGTPKDIIRNYFLNNFYSDHCQMYSLTGSGKRPIYWLFDSGKQNGFKALVYMHRWNADTVGNLRVEYLHKMQKIYEKEIESCQDTIDNSLNNREIAAATKRKEKLVKQLKECKEYDAKIAHIALSRIDIDLDDGVKFNYRKVQTGADGRFCEILADSKDIMIKEDSPIWQGRKKA